jgi:hypothetical protein
VNRVGHGLGVMVCEGAPIHVFVDCIKGKTWMAGLPPAMTAGRCRSRIEALIQRRALTRILPQYGGSLRPE